MFLLAWVRTLRRCCFFPCVFLPLRCLFLAIPGMGRARASPLWRLSCPRHLVAWEALDLKKREGGRQRSTKTTTRTGVKTVGKLN